MCLSNAFPPPRAPERGIRERRKPQPREEASACPAEGEPGEEPNEV